VKRLQAKKTFVVVRTSDNRLLTSEFAHHSVAMKGDCPKHLSDLMPLPTKWRPANHKLDRESGQAWIFHVKPASAGYPNAVFALKRLKNPSRKARFVRELAVMTALHDMGIQVVPAIFDSDLDTINPYYVIEWCEDGSLEERVQNGHYLKAPIAGVDHLIELANGLHQVHKAGVAHRDLKPSNVLLSRTDLWLVDFGLCLEADSCESRQTAEMEAVGSRLYIAPENESGINEEVDQRPADFYAFGKIVWAILAGRQPPARERHRDPEWRLEQLTANPQYEFLRALLDRLITSDPRMRLNDWSHVVNELMALKSVLQGKNRLAPPNSSTALASNLDKVAELSIVRDQLAREKEIQSRRQWSETLVNTLKQEAGEIQTELDELTKRSGNALRFAVTRYERMARHMRVSALMDRLRGLDLEGDGVVSREEQAPVAFIVHSPGDLIPVPVFTLAVIVLTQPNALWFFRVPFMYWPPEHVDMHVPEWLLPIAFKMVGPLPFFLEQTIEEAKAFVGETASIFLDMVEIYSAQAANGHGKNLLCPQGWPTPLG